MDKKMQLKDGRTLAYTEHGDLKGKPVFFIHGNPGSRLVRHPDESIAEKLGVRIITPDRPGYGMSDFQPGRKLTDFPLDIVQLADHLEIDQFAIFGVSAGGPYVAACAYQLAGRITGAAIVSGAAPIDRPNAYEGMADVWQQAFQMSAWPTILLKPLLKMRANMDRKDPEGALERTAEIVSENDRKILQDPAIREDMMNRSAEATRNGVAGWVREAKILIAPWEVELNEIKPTVHLWYWAADPAIPLGWGKYLDEQIPNTVPHFLPDGGHLSIFEHWGEILSELVK